MVSDLYAFDLETYVWEKIAPFPEDDVPKPRYFHSTDTCKPVDYRFRGSPLNISREQPVDHLRGYEQRA